MKSTAYTYKIAASFMLLFLLYNTTTRAQDNYVRHKMINYKGNAFEIQTFAKDTTEVMDPVTGKTSMVVTSRQDVVLSMNGVQTVPAGNDEQATIVRDELAKEVAQTLRKSERKLGSGTYNFSVSNIVIDSRGKIVYQQPAYIRRVQVIGMDGSAATTELKTEERARVQNKIKDILENMTITPLAKEGKPVISTVDIKGDFIIR